MLSKPFKLYSKSAIPALFKKHNVNLKPEPYVAAAQVFPMRLNSHVVDSLINWQNAEEDPMFRLSVPQPGMLRPKDLDSILLAMEQPDMTNVGIREITESIRQRLNPHPAGQKEENVPRLHGSDVSGLQHKYRETVLFFPSEGQYCHAFCTYCFRWAQFTSVGSDQAFKSSNRDVLLHYLHHHPTVTDVLFTGGDPMVMPAATMRNYVENLIGANAPPNLETIRIGTKSLAWWPYRYISDPEATAILQLFADIVKSNKHLTIQAHFTHPREIEHPAAQEAVRLIRMTGAQVRSQAPLIKNINDDPVTWSRMWRLQTRLGIVPYYMFVERDTGARDFFSVPLAQASKIFNEAYTALPGTARTVRGPSMSASPGKICVLGDEVVGGERCFVLKFLQSRNPKWSERLFFAKYDPKAIWFDELVPAFGEKEFFFSQEYNSQKHAFAGLSSGQLTNVNWKSYS